MVSIDEKSAAVLGSLENVEAGDNGSDHVEFTEAEKKHITRRIDFRITFILGVLLCFSLIDRNNMGTASVAGMNHDLGMNAANNGYSIASFMFFILYVLIQPVASVLVRKFGPRNFITTICILWSCIVIGLGFVKHWQHLMGLRIILGLFEGGFSPATTYLLSTWYTRYEVGQRFSYVFMLAAIASATSGLLGYGLMQMHGVGGLAGWRWIFIMEGIITFLLALAAYTFIVPFPDADAHTAFKFLNKAEVNYVIQKIEADRGDAQIEEFNLKRFLSGGKDIKIYFLGSIYGLSAVVTYALAFFLPIILRQGMGFSISQSLLLTIPPYACNFVWLYITGIVSDKYRSRGPVIIFNCLLEIMGVVLIGWSPTNASKYTGVFFCCIGASANVPLALTYQANNIRGQWKRALSSATIVIWGAIGGIAGSLVFRPQDAPTYHPGLYAALVAATITILNTCGLMAYFKWANNKADRGEMILEESEEFRYTL
ncbi:hypothetical protein ABW20_dc0106454 [Dactylellina cionopaga]|nr:hypothetical protein ABW20_dc0106454 [Dactylellina cionopaga]